MCDTLPPIRPVPGQRSLLDQAVDRLVRAIDDQGDDQPQPEACYPAFESGMGDTYVRETAEAAMEILWISAVNLQMVLDQRLGVLR